MSENRENCENRKNRELKITKTAKKVQNLSLTPISYTSQPSHSFPHPIPSIAPPSLPLNLPTCSFTSRFLRFSLFRGFCGPKIVEVLPLNNCPFSFGLTFRTKHKIYGLHSFKRFLFFSLVPWFFALNA